MRTSWLVAVGDDENVALAGAAAVAAAVVVLDWVGLVAGAGGFLLWWVRAAGAIGAVARVDCVTVTVATVRGADADPQPAINVTAVTVATVRIRWPPLSMVSSVSLPARVMPVQRESRANAGVGFA